MYFNDKKENTNIDGEFESNKFNFKKIKWLSIIVIFVLILFILLMIFLNKNNKDYFLELIGEENIKIYQNSDYIEFGYKAYDEDGNDLTDSVDVKSNINTSVTGEYEIVYSIGDVSITRYITVIEEPIGETYIYLMGDLTVYLDIGEKYDEVGYFAIDSIDGELTKKVETTGNVDSSKAGVYNIIYSVVNSSGVTTSAKRTVIVMGIDITLSLSTKEYTNKSVNIDVYVNDSYFDYLILPNGDKVSKNKYSYSVDENGTYKFISYNKKGSKKEDSVTVSNIDKTAPTGSCSGFYKEGISTIKMSASDTSGIDRYVINGKTYTSNSITINSEISVLNVIIYDKVGNSKSISCTLKNNNPTYDNPINPQGNENIKYNVKTNTLNVWIEEKSTYYVSHVWVKEPYKQLKSAVPNNFGSQLSTSKVILEGAIQSHNFQNKVIIAVNGSGFVLNGTYDQAYYNANSAWNKTSVSPIVIVEGNVLRDISSGRIPSNKHVTYGLKKDGTLAYYEYKAGTGIQSNIDTSQRIINDGVLNTFAFNPVLVWDGSVVSSSTSADIRQGFCQIDKNNFVFITNKPNRSTGFSFKTLGEYMVQLGCKTGFNLDGGGSTSLLFKDSSNNISVITGNTRNIADILYFHE